ncbi:VanZ family protein [Nocardiopsis baichengensis]|uniref:VanZ family protein n=1 Tax=Nocardiopsis baichengensis TaxID=280240 RepID=UPI00034643C8|nr:VanZ family protein [Nocardiopsis baichengensis]
MGRSSVTAALEGAVLVSPVRVLLFAVLVRIRRRRRADRLPAVLDSAADLLCAVSVLGIVSLTLLNPGTVGGLALVPFSVTASSGPEVTGLCQNGGNVALFLALGAFLSPARWPRLLAAAAAVPVTVEGLQYLMARGHVAPVDDVLLNCAGALLGACITRPWWRTGPRTAPVADPARGGEGAAP